MPLIQQVIQELQGKISSFSSEDSFLINNRNFAFDFKNFLPLTFSSLNKTIAFIDGGQAELLIAGNFCVSFIRVAALLMQGEKKLRQEKKEFFLLTTAKQHQGEIWYENKIFSETKNPVLKTLILEEDLFVSSQDPHLKNGRDPASIAKITSMARRFAELTLAAELALSADFVLLDGTLEKIFPQEEEYLQKLSQNTAALAKSSSLFTASGNSPTLFLKKNGPQGCWQYTVDANTSFVKLHEKSKHVFRCEGNKETLSILLPRLISQCTDATFLGYPYGLILVDKLARVSNEEKKSLQMRFLLDKENKNILEHLSANNAHEILDGKYTF